MPGNNTLIRLQLEQPREFRTPFQVRSFGSTVTPGNENYRFACRNELEFCFRLNSEEEYAEDILDNQRYRNTFPHLFVKLPGVSYQYRIQAQRTAFFLIYSAEDLGRFEAAGLSFSPPGFEFELTAELQAIFAQLNALFPFSQQRGIAEKVDLLGLQLIEEICIRQAQERHPGTIYEQSIRAIASELQLHPEHIPDFDQLAAQHGLSRRSFFRYWRHYYSISPARYHFEAKMLQAQHLLTDGNWPVARVATHLGFHNSTYFIQAFKRHFHTTPGRSRRTGIQTRHASNV